MNNEKSERPRWPHEEPLTYDWLLVNDSYLWDGSCELFPKREEGEFPTLGYETHENILGGEPVFPGTRLSVMHIGKCISNGAVKETILQDYPYLTDANLDFALKFYRYVTACRENGRLSHV